MSRERVLVIKLAAMGDIIATSPIIRSLEVAGYDVWMLTFSEYSQSVILDGSKILTINRSNKFMFLITVLLVLIKAWLKKFDVGFCFHRRARLFSFFLWMLGIPKRYGFTDSSDELYTKSRCYKIDKNRTLQEFDVLDLAQLDYSKLTPIIHL